jgi:hypothetical protein
MKILKPGFYNQWGALLERAEYNFRDFVVVRLEIERDRIIGGWTLSLGLIGFTLNVTVITDEDQYSLLMGNFNDMMLDLKKRQQLNNDNKENDKDV